MSPRPLRDILQERFRIAELFVAKGGPFFCHERADLAVVRAHERLVRVVAC